MFINEKFVPEQSHPELRIHGDIPDAATTQPNIHDSKSIFVLAAILLAPLPILVDKLDDDFNHCTFSLQLSAIIRVWAVVSDALG